MEEVSRTPIIRQRSRPSSPSANSQRSDVETGAVSVTDLPPAKGDYEIGRGKPPKQHQFKPGQSGNPKGRPKGARGMKAMVRDLLQKKIAMRTPKGVRKVPHVEALLLRLLECGLKGDQRAIDRLLAHYVSAVPDAVEPGSEAAPELMGATDAMILEQYRKSIESRLAAGGRDG